MPRTTNAHKNICPRPIARSPLNGFPTWVMAVPQPDEGNSQIERNIDTMTKDLCEAAGLSDAEVDRG